VPFLACGDLSGFDADRNYELPEDYVYHEVVAPPISPAYEFAVQLKKQNKRDTVIVNEEAVSAEIKEEPKRTGVAPPPTKGYDPTTVFSLVAGGAAIVGFLLYRWKIK
jgi:hypothetical protein